MEPTGTPARPNLLQRLRGAFLPTAFTPVLQQSTRMPDLESWSMPHRAVDMKDWEVALNMAQNNLQPDRTRLMDLYESILIDSHLASVMESRVLRVARSKYKLVGPDGKPKPELVELFEQSWFEDFLRWTAEAVFRGHTLIELSTLEKPGKLTSITRIDPRNVLPWTGVVVKQMGQQTGYLFREEPYRPYFIELGRPNDLGLLCRVAPVAIVKKYAIGSWSDFMGKFGIPPRWVKTGTTDKKRFKQLETMMQQMVSSAYAVLNTDEEIQIMPTPGTDAHQVFDALISRMNSEMSKRVLGQDGTSDNKDATGTYGSLKVLQGVAEDRHQADKATVMYAINNELFPRLINLGYPLKGIRFQWDELRDMSPTELVEAVAKLGVIYDIDPKHVEERTGIRILGARRMPGEVGDSNAPTPGNPPGNGKQGGKKSDAKKTEEGGDDDEDEDGVEASWPRTHVPLCGICGGQRGITAEEVPNVGDEATEALIRAGYDGKAWSQAYTEVVADIYMRALDRAWKPDLSSLTYDAPDHVVRAMMDANLFRFAGLKTLAAAHDLNTMVKEGEAFGRFKARVDESGVMKGYNVDQLRTEHVNVTLTGIQAGRWYDMQRSADVLPFGEYVTIGDDAVRPAHAVLNGKKWPLGHPAWRNIWPPNGWRCRCTVLPTAEGPDGKEADKQWAGTEQDLRNSGEYARMKKGGFDGNRAISGEVFRLNSAFRDVLDRDLSFNIEDSYGRKDMMWSSINERGNLPMVIETIKDNEGMRRWYMGQRNADGVAVLNDHAGRPWVLEERTIEDHTKPKYAADRRFGIVDLIPDVLKVPDEVWMTGRGGDVTQLAYVRFYQDRPVVVRASISAAKGTTPTMRVTGWYEMEVRKEHTVRNGLLVKKMPGDA